ncbi:MAG: adenylate/guanylate cyclase domain-containing protein [Spirochaetales bacterium]|nr:MAG: adenylate/guanylate cyclase domain-containing protein [Spirochaetales bacterium]
MEQKKFVPITTKINLIIIISLILGIGSTTFYFARSLFFTIDGATKKNLNQQSEILYTAIQNYMLPGQAPLAVEFFKDIESSNPDYEIKLYRRTKAAAFSDNTTIDDVNNRLKRIVFKPRQEPAIIIDDPVDEYFQVSLGSPPDTAIFQTEKNGTFFINIYKPLINLPKCTGCHGSDHTIRGVVNISSNISGAIMSQRNSIIISGSLFLGLVFVLTVLLSIYLRSSILRPVQIIGDVCRDVTGGHFDKRVKIKSRDEVGLLGETVNQMVEGLFERFELSKFVSLSTIQSLKGDKAGQNVPVTLLFSDIRGFTAYSDRNPPEVVVAHLNRILNVQTEIIHANGGDIDKYVGDEIVALFPGEESGLAACRTAIAIMKNFSEKSAADYGGLRVGIGINTGDVILGMIGSEKRADFTTIGDNVNVASRLCSAAKMDQILMADSTWQKVKDNVIVEGPYKIKVKGKDKYIRVHILLGCQREDCLEFVKPSGGLIAD